MKAIIKYQFSFKKGANGRIRFWLAGEGGARFQDLNATDFCAVVSLLSLGNSYYNTEGNYFISDSQNHFEELSENKADLETSKF